MCMCPDWYNDFRISGRKCQEALNIMKTYTLPGFSRLPSRKVKVLYFLHLLMNHPLQHFQNCLTWSLVKGRHETLMKMH
jgi:hypothetical protein